MSIGFGMIIKVWGGPMLFSSLGGSIGFTASPILSSLRRTIRDVISAGIRPDNIRSSDLERKLYQRKFPTQQRDLYFIEDLLLPGDLWRPVVHSTHYFSSGWGARVLSMSEMGAAFGYPRHVYDHLEHWVFSQPPHSVLVAVYHAGADICGTFRVERPLNLEPALEYFHPSTESSLRVHSNEGSFLPGLQRWLPHTWIKEGTASQQATKRDDAAVPVHLWDMRILLLFPLAGPLIAALRKLCLHRYWRNVLRDLRVYMRECYGIHWVQRLYTSLRSKVCLIGQQTGGEMELMVREIVIAREAMEKITRSTWWEWPMGSSLIFWRWNKDDVQIARDGMTPFIHGELPNWRPKSRRKRILEPKFSLIANKLKTIVDKNYVAPGKVSSWTEFFEVPKGDDDIRLVYNGTSCGLNRVVWVPSFWLPFPRSASRLLDFNYFSADMDLGEMFHNFPLHETIQEYSGIDLSMFQDQLGIKKEVADGYRWTRTWMGAWSSPYSCVRCFHITEEFIRGNRLDKDNALRWDEIVCNLPGDEHYNPSKPRVQKWDNINCRIAGDFVTFVDDGRITGETLEHTWAINRQVCSRVQYRGIQVAFRKIHEPKRNPGPWAGAVFETTDTTVTKSVSLDKWNKGKRLIQNLWNQLDSDVGNGNQISYKELEITRGFLCHLSMTFEFLVPYLKGFHLTLASHLNNRDREGWKYTDKMWKIYLDHQVEEGFLGVEEATKMLEGNTYSTNTPDFISPVEQLKDDVYAIREFLMADFPPKIQERSSMVQVVRYGFGDASGSGFGSTIQTKDGLKYRIGVWGSDDQGESSNYKELENVVSTIEAEAEIGNLKDSVLFFFTDNATVEAALYKGNSSSRKLFLLVVRFRKLYFTYGTQIIVSHVSGKRMIEQGTDGVSRGVLNEGVGSGLDMLQFIPLHKGALERHPPLANWLKLWMGNEVEFLDPKGWFTRGHDHDGGHRDEKGFWHINTREGVFVWAPAPGAAEVAMEELRKALIKRQKSTHVFICPRLLTTEWLKQLYKAADLIISIPAGAVEEAWPLNMHEPLTVGFIFPLLPFNPWQRKSTPQMFHVERQLSKLFKGQGLASRDFLCKFFKTQRELSGLSELLVRRVLYLRK